MSLLVAWAFHESQHIGDRSKPRMFSEGDSDSVSDAPSLFLALARKPCDSIAILK